MVKIEIVDNAEAKIYNGTNTVKLNSKNPVAKIVGGNYKVKTNYDTMISFYGKLFKYLQQKELYPDKNGKWAKITTNSRTYYFIESWFEGYNPLNAEIFWNSKMSDDYTGYVEKIFEEKKNK